MSCHPILSWIHNHATFPVSNKKGAIFVLETKPKTSHICPRSAHKAVTLLQLWLLPTCGAKACELRRRWHHIQRYTWITIQSVIGYHYAGISYVLKLNNVKWNSWLKLKNLQEAHDVISCCSLTRVQSYCIDSSSEIRGTFSLWMMELEPKSHASFSGELLGRNSPWGWGWVMLHSALVWDVQARNVHAYHKKSCLVSHARVFTLKL